MRRNQHHSKFNIPLLVPLLTTGLMTLIIFVMCVYVKLYIIYRVIYNIYIYWARITEASAAGHGCCGI